MRYIKLFEKSEDVDSAIQLKEFFKDKINWKLYNYLVDICTKYEDKLGIDFEISVQVESTGRYGGTMQVLYDDKYNSGLVQYYTDFIKSDYVINGLLYCIYCRVGLVEIDGVKRDVSLLMMEIFGVLKMKFNVVVVNHTGSMGLSFKESK